MSCNQCKSMYRGGDALVRCRKYHFCNFMTDGNPCTGFKNNAFTSAVANQTEWTLSFTNVIEPLIELSKPTVASQLRYQ